MHITSAEKQNPIKSQTAQTIAILTLFSTPFPFSKKLTSGGFEIQADVSMLSVWATNNR
jgi:hypothetical protein